MITLQNLFEQDKMVLITNGENQTVKDFKSIIPSKFYYEVDVKDLNGNLISLLVSKGIYLYKFPILVWENGFFDDKEISDKNILRYLVSKVDQKTGKYFKEKVDEIDNLNNKIIAFKDNGVFILTCFDEGTISLKDNWFFTSLKAGVRFPSGLNHEDTYIFDSYKKEIISHENLSRKPTALAVGGMRTYSRCSLLPKCLYPLKGYVYTHDADS